MNHKKNEIQKDDGSYQIHIADMSCTSCVGTVERAIAEVPGVIKSQVNLIEKKAWVVGGDPNSVLNAILDQAYDAHLIEESLAVDRLFLQFTGENNDQLEPLLKTLGSEIEYNWPQVSLSTHIHPADLLLQLQQSNYIVSLEEQFKDPHKVQAEEAAHEVHRSWQRAILAGSVGGGLMLGDMSGLFPALAEENGQFFWGFMAFVCLFSMWFSGRNYYKTAIKKARHFSSTMAMSSVTVVTNANRLRFFKPKI